MILVKVMLVILTTCTHCNNVFSYLYKRLIEVTQAKIQNKNNVEIILKQISGVIMSVLPKF